MADNPKTAKRVSQKSRLLAASYIGHWVGRMKNGKPVTELHLVESAINDEIVTRCGLHVKASILKNGTGMALAEYFPDTAVKHQTCRDKAAPGEVPGHDDETPFPQSGDRPGLLTAPPK